MTVPVQVPEARSTASGSTGTFALGFGYEDVAHVRVSVEVDGEETLLTQGDDYTVTGGNAVIADWPEAGAIVRRWRVTPALQDEEFGDTVKFQPLRNERAFDRLARKAQEQDARLNRSLTAPVGETLATLPGEADRASRYLKFDADGEPAAGASATEFEADVAATAAAAVAAAASASAAATAEEGAEQALTDTQAAATAALTNIGNAETAALSAIGEDNASGARGDAIDAIAAQQTTSVNAVDAQGDTSVAAVQAQQTTSVAAVAAQQTTSVNAVDAQGDTSVAAVQTQQTASVAAVVDAENAATAAVAGAAEDIVGLVPVIEGTADLINDSWRFHDDENMCVFTDPNGVEIGRIVLSGAWSIELLAVRFPGGFRMEASGRVNDDGRIPVVQMDADGKERVLYWLGEAEGSTPLAERLDPTLSDTGVPLTPTLNLHTLRRTRTRLRQLRNGDSKRFVVNCGEDSYGQNSLGWAVRLAEWLHGEHPDGGGGWTGFGGGSTLNGNVRASDYEVELGAGWTRLSPFDPSSPDLCYAECTTNGATITVVYPATPVHSGVDLYWIGTASGEVSVTIDGGAAQTIDCSGSGMGVTALTGDLSGGGTIVITAVGTDQVRLAGLHFKSAASGVVVNKVAASGAATAQWVAGDGANQATWLGNSEPDLILWIGGTNTKGDDQTPADYAADLTTFIERARAAVPGVDILIGMEPENVNPGTYTMAAYAAAARQVCWTEGVAFIDFQSFFGATMADYDKDAPLALLGSDNIHPSVDGYAGGIVAPLLELTPLGTR